VFSKCAIVACTPNVFFNLTSTWHPACYLQRFFVIQIKAERNKDNGSGGCEVEGEHLNAPVDSNIFDQFR
jgi:hypothetical protein